MVVLPPPTQVATAHASPEQAPLNPPVLRSPGRLRVLPVDREPPTPGPEVAPPVAVVAPVPLLGPTVLSGFDEHEKANPVRQASEPRTLTRRNVARLIRFFMAKPGLRAHALPKAAVVCAFPTEKFQVSLWGKSEALPLCSLQTACLHSQLRV